MIDELKASSYNAPFDASCTNQSQATYPNIGHLDVVLMVKLRKGLVKADLGHRLPYQSLAFFMGLGHARVENDYTADQIRVKLIDSLDIIEMESKATYITPSAPLSEEGGEGGSVDEGILITTLRQVLVDIRNLSRDTGVALCEQHEGTTTHASLEDLMIKIANCVDKSSLEIYEAQVLALQAEQMAVSNTHKVEKALDDVVDLLQSSGSAMIGTGQNMMRGRKMRK